MINCHACRISFWEVDRAGIFDSGIFARRGEAGAAPRVGDGESAFCLMGEADGVFSLSGGEDDTNGTEV